MIVPASSPLTDSPPFIRPISDGERRDVNVAGRHGASLCEPLEAGRPVAPGFVVTTQAFTVADGACGIGLG